MIRLMRIVVIFGLIASCFGFVPLVRRKMVGSWRASSSSSENEALKKRATEILEKEVYAIEGEQANTFDTKGMLAGAVVGGVLGGPIGVFLGANVGSYFGGTSSETAARRKRLAALGVDDDMLRQQESALKDLEEADQAIDSATRARDSARSFAAVLTRDRDAAQAAAENAVAQNDDESAKKYLRSRLALDQRCADAEARLEEAEKRLAQAKAGHEYFQERANEIETLCYRTIVANYDNIGSEYDPFSSSPSLPPLRDPVLDRFKALEDKQRGGGGSTSDSSKGNP